MNSIDTIEISQLISESIFAANDAASALEDSGMDLLAKRLDEATMILRMVQDDVNESM